MRDSLIIHFDWMKKIIIFWRELDYKNKGCVKLDEKNYIRANKIIHKPGRRYGVKMGVHFSEPDGHSIGGVAPDERWQDKKFIKKHINWLRKIKAF